MASSQDLIKYITQQVVTYIETPRDVRKQKQQETVKEPWTYRWFGMIPISFRIWLDRRRKNK